MYDIKINSSAEFYKNYLNYKSKYNNKLLNSNTSFSEVYIEVDKYRKKDFLLVLKEQPLLIILNIVNSITRHLFTSSDYFNFTKHNADKMGHLIKISDCIKLTPICIYEYKFDKLQKSESELYIPSFFYALWLIKKKIDLQKKTSTLLMSK